MTQTITVYHHPRCSKSRATVEWITQQGVEFDIIEYVKSPLDKPALLEILDKLDMRADEIIRKGEKRYKELGLHEGNRSDDELLDAIAENPILLERPIVTTTTSAAIGRPLENIIELFDDM